METAELCQHVVCFFWRCVRIYTFSVCRKWRTLSCVVVVTFNQALVIRRPTERLPGRSELPPMYSQRPKIWGTRRRSAEYTRQRFCVIGGRDVLWARWRWMGRIKWDDLFHLLEFSPCCDHTLMQYYIWIKHCYRSVISGLVWIIFVMITNKWEHVLVPNRNIWLFLNYILHHVTHLYLGKILGTYVARSGVKYVEEVGRSVQTWKVTHSSELLSPEFKQLWLKEIFHTHVWVVHLPSLKYTWGKRVFTAVWIKRW